MNNKILKGSCLIALGAGCYGMLATYVKMAYQGGFTTAEVTFSQFSIGLVVLFVLDVFTKRRSETTTRRSALKSKLKLILAGSSLGLTSVCYYMSVKYVPVSVAIVLLMQTVWMGLVLEMIMNKAWPGSRKLLSVVIIGLGTLLAMNMLEQTFRINWTGFAWGMMAALCYTATMYTSNTLELHLPPLKRSLYMIFGGWVVIGSIFHSAITQHFSCSIFLHWGPLVAVFGTILPPLLLTRGMPLTGMGLGAIVASLEIPVSVLMAHLLLNEQVHLSQWLGLGCILLAVVLMNTPGKQFKKKHSKN